MGGNGPSTRPYVASPHPHPHPPIPTHGIGERRPKAAWKDTLGKAAITDRYSGGQTPRQKSQLRSCVKVEVAVLGSPSLIVLMFSVDVKQH